MGMSVDSNGLNESTACDSEYLLFGLAAYNLRFKRLVGFFCCVLTMV
jgi:hypothetical protein